MVCVPGPNANRSWIDAYVGEPGVALSTDILFSSSSLDTGVMQSDNAIMRPYNMAHSPTKVLSVDRRETAWVAFYSRLKSH